MRPRRRQPTRLPRPWDSPGKNTGVGCHFILQCVKVKSEIEVSQSCPTSSDLMDCSLPGTSIHGIFQASVLEWSTSPQNKLLALKSLSQSFLLGEPKLRHHGKGERLVCNMILVFLELSASWDAGLSVPDVGKSWTSLDRLTTVIGR